MSTTPLLDREQPLPKAKRATKWWLPLLVGALFGGVLILFNVDIDRFDTLFPGQALLLGFVPALYFGVLIHELGHLVAGLSAGFDPRAFMVGVFLFTRETQGWKFRFLPQRILTGGLTRMVPKSADRLMDRYLRLVLGGPAATLLLFVITLIWTLTSPNSAVAEVLFLINLLMLIVAFLPFTVRGQPNDAKQILVLTRKGPAAERLAAMMYLLALDTQQVGPRDWPRELVEKIGIPTQDKAFLSAAVSFRYADALESGDAERIAEAIERALAVSPESGPDVRRAFFASASFFHSMCRSNVPLAEAWLENARQVKNTISQKDWDSKALAGIALAKGEPAQARELLVRYLALLDRRPPSGLLAAERARAVDMLGRAEGAAA